MYNDNFGYYSSREGLIMKKWIGRTPWLRNYVEKHEAENTNLHDSRVYLKDGTQFTVEIKEEELYWFNKTGNIGLDYISAFYFTNQTVEKYWKKTKKYWVPTYKISKFIDRDITVGKWGKLVTCDANIQLFYVENNGKIVFMRAYDNSKLQDASFINHLKNNYNIRINKKNDYNLADDWESAAFFVNPLKDIELQKCEVNSLNDLKNTLNR